MWREHADPGGRNRPASSRCGPLAGPQGLAVGLVDPLALVILDPVVVADGYQFLPHPVMRRTIATAALLTPFLPPFSEHTSSSHHQACRSFTATCLSLTGETPWGLPVIARPGQPSMDAASYELRMRAFSAANSSSVNIPCVFSSARSLSFWTRSSPPPLAAGEVHCRGAPPQAGPSRASKYHSPASRMRSRR